MSRSNIIPSARPNRMPLVAAACIFKKGGSCQKSSSFHQLGKKAQEERELSENANVADLAFSFLPHRSRQYRGEKNAL